MVTRRRARSSATCALVLAGLCVAGAASADPPTEAEKALAKQLRQDGLALVKSGKVSDGCVKLATSHGFDPERGTLMDLAACHEKEGKLARAWVDYRNAVGLAGTAGDHALEAQARDHAALLDKRVPRVTFTAPPGDVPKGFEVRVDDTPIDVRGTLSLDPGKHVVTATAPDRKPWRSEIVAKEGSADAIALPKLEGLPAEQTLGVGVAQPPPPEDPSTRRDRWRMPVGVTLTVVGQAALVAGTIGAVTAYAQRNGGSGKDAKIVLATVGFVAGVALSTVGIYLLVAGPRSDPDPDPAQPPGSPPPATSARARRAPSLGVFVGPEASGIWGRF